MRLRVTLLVATEMNAEDDAIDKVRSSQIVNNGQRVLRGYIV